ncbi:MAG: chloride channel protein, partial [Solirubrobacteraceae bacterium]
VHRGPKSIRARVSLVKIIASAITIGSGGSGGREGPTAQISAGFGSLLARWLRLSPSDARIAVTVGIGSGIGAIFRAPLGGAVLGAEIPYRDDVETDALIPSVIASIVAFAIFGAFEGYDPIFGFLSGYRFHHALQLLYFALIGLAAGAMGRLYARTFYDMSSLFRRLRVPAVLKPALGGLLTALIAVALPGVLGTGYGWVQTSMGHGLLALPLWVVLALPFAKIVATACSIGSGGSGGIFGPGMVIGGFTGAALWRLLQAFAPMMPHSPAPFVIVGMIACFGSIAHAPLAVMLMVSEMTGSLALLAPAMVAVGLATLVAGDHTIYRSQLGTRAESPGHGVRMRLPLLSTTTVATTMSPPRLTLAASQPATEALQRLRALGLAGAPVVDERGAFAGSAFADALAAHLAAGFEGPVADLLGGPASTLSPDATLDAAVEALTAAGRSWLPVVGGGRVLGIVGMTEVIGGYREALSSNLQALAGPTGTALVERRLTPGSPLEGRSVGEVSWPPGTLILALGREGQLIFPDGATVLEPDDLVSALVSPAGVAPLERMLAPGGEEEGDDGMELI